MPRDEASSCGLKEKVVIVTGATRGIGRAIAEIFCKCGAYVIGTGTTVEKGKKEGISFFPLDMRSKKSMDDFLEYIESMPAVDVLINNAGVNILAGITEIEEGVWRDIIDINLTGPMRLSKKVAAIMKRNKKGRILNISSIWGVIGKERRSAYAASKAGLIGLTRSMAIDLGPYHILVNALCPGFTLTELTESTLTHGEMKELADQVPLGRFASVDEIAHTALFLCSDLNTYITGQHIIVDGGFTVR